MKYLTKKKAIAIDPSGYLLNLTSCKLPIPHIVAINYLSNFGTHHPVQINCENCKISTVIPWAKIKRRIYPNKPLCNKCYIKYFNSLPEIKEANSLRMKERYKDKTLRNLHRENSKKLWDSWRKDPQKMEIIKQNAKKLHTTECHNKIRYRNGIWGEYLCRGEWIEFDSSWELRYLMWAEHNPNIESIKRCRMIIPYFDAIKNKNRNYYPDYVINNKIVTEIKGSRHDGEFLCNTQSKLEYATQYVKKHNMDYNLLTEKWLKQNIPLFKRTTKGIIGELVGLNKIKFTNDKLKERYGQS